MNAIFSMISWSFPSSMLFFVSFGFVTKLTSLNLGWWPLLVSHIRCSLFCLSRSLFWRLSDSCLWAWCAGPVIFIDIVLGLVYGRWLNGEEDWRPCYGFMLSHWWTGDLYLTSVSPILLSPNSPYDLQGTRMALQNYLWVVLAKFLCVRSSLVSFCLGTRLRLL